MASSHREDGRGNSGSSSDVEQEKLLLRKNLERWMSEELTHTETLDEQTIALISGNEKYKRTFDFIINRVHSAENVQNIRANLLLSNLTPSDGNNSVAVTVSEANDDEDGIKNMETQIEQVEKEIKHIKSEILMNKNKHMLRKSEARKQHKKKALLNDGYDNMFPNMVQSTKTESKNVLVESLKPIETEVHKCIRLLNELYKGTPSKSSARKHKGSDPDKEEDLQEVISYIQSMDLDSNNDNDTFDNNNKDADINSNGTDIIDKAKEVQLETEELIKSMSIGELSAQVCSISKQQASELREALAANAEEQKHELVEVQQEHGIDDELDEGRVLTDILLRTNKQYRKYAQLNAKGSAGNNSVDKAMDGEKEILKYLEGTSNADVGTGSNMEDRDEDMEGDEDYMVQLRELASVQAQRESRAHLEAGHIGDLKQSVQQMGRGCERLLAEIGRQRTACSTDLQSGRDKVPEAAAAAAHRADVVREYVQRVQQFDGGAAEGGPSTSVKVSEWEGGRQARAKEMEKWVEECDADEKRLRERVEESVANRSAVLQRLRATTVTQMEREVAAAERFADGDVVETQHEMRTLVTQPALQLARQKLASS